MNSRAHFCCGFNAGLQLSARHPTLATNLSANERDFFSKTRKTAACPKFCPAKPKANTERRAQNLCRSVAFVSAACEELSQSKSACNTASATWKDALCCFFRRGACRRGKCHAKLVIDSVVRRQRQVVASESVQGARARENWFDLARFGSSGAFFAWRSEDGALCWLRSAAMPPATPRGRWGAKLQRNAAFLLLMGRWELPKNGGVKGFWACYDRETGILKKLRACRRFGNLSGLLFIWIFFLRNEWTFYSS